MYLEYHYIRTVNSEYSTGYGGYWQLLAGGTPKSFIDYVNSDDTHGLKFNEYFSSFLPYSAYNVQEHGDISKEYQNDDKSQLKLIDPFDKKNKIDLIHMFACMDGIYAGTSNTLSCGNNNQRDILSWNGDLQTAA